MDEIYETAFNLILSAGNSKSNSMMAIQAAREFRFEDAEELMQQAQQELTNAHQVQTDLIQSEARGEKCEVNIIMVHAQDHLSMALMAVDNAKEMIHVYKMIYELKKQINKEK